MIENPVLTAVVGTLVAFSLLYAVHLVVDKGPSKGKPFKEKVKDFFFAVTHPRYWTTIHPYNENWDLDLNEAMEKNTFEIIDGYTARIGDRTTWIRNHPYGSFTRYEFSMHERNVARVMMKQVRPSRRTTHKAMKKFIEDCMFETGKDRELLKYLLAHYRMYQ